MKFKETFKNIVNEPAKLIAGSLLSIFTLSILLAPASAQERKYYGIVINPAIIHLNLAPGELYEGSIELINDFQHQETVTYYSVAQNFKQNGESGDPLFYIDESTPDAINASKWVSFPEDKHELVFGERVASKFSIQVPENADPGGYYTGVIYVSRDPDSEENNKENVAINSAISTLLFITVDGEINEDGVLLDFETDKSWYEFLPVNYKIRYQNEGNIHSTVGGNIFIYKSDITDSVDILTVNEASGFTLPGSVRSYYNTQNGGMLQFDSEGKLKFHRENLPKIYFGKYKATLKLKHPIDNERVTTEKTIEFWVIPWRLLIALCVLVGAVVAGFILRNRSKSKPQANK